MTPQELIAQHVKMTPDLVAAISQRINIEEHKKGTTLLQEGDICRKLYFVEKGMIRFFYTNEMGKDITHWFAPEQSFLTEVVSYFNQSPSQYYLEVLEDSTLLTITLDGLNFLLDNFPELERFGRIFSLQMAVEFGQKIIDLQFRTAQERYQLLIKKHPDILKRASLGHIASFLGITQQSLSRIRSNKNY